MSAITVQAADLAAALKHGVAPTRSTLDTILHARLRMDGDKLRVETTDTEVWAQATVPATGDAGVDILLRDDLLRSAVAGASGELVIADSGQVRNGRSRYAIPARSGADFPTSDDVTWRAVDMDPAALAAALRAVSYSGEADSPNHAFRAVMVVPGLVWATDGKQVGAVALDYAGPRIAVPVAQVPRVAAALELPGARTEVAGGSDAGAGLLRVVADGLQVSLRLLPAAAMDMARMVRGLNPGESCVVVRRDGLIAALRRFMPFVAFNLGKKLPSAALALADRGLTLRDRKSEFLEALDGVVVGDPKGAWTIAFDPKRLLLALQAIPTDTVDVFPFASGAGVTSGLICLVPTGRSPQDVAHLLAPITE